MGYIYGLAHPETNEIRYIGMTQKTPQGRLYSHCSKASEKRSAKDQWICSLGDGLPSIVVLEQGKFTREYLSALEREWIRYGRLLGWRLLNRAKGGDGGYTGLHNAATRAKMSISQTGRQHSEESKEKRRKAMLGFRHSEETIEKLRGLKRTEETRAKLAERARNRSPEHLAKLRAAAQNRSPEYREKQRIAQTGKKLSPETQAKISKGVLAKREAIQQGGRTTGHLRWHVARGIISPTCALCAAMEHKGEPSS